MATRTPAGSTTIMHESRGQEGSGELVTAGIPRTYDPSIVRWQDFFGKPQGVTEAAIPPFEREDVTTHVMPQAYMGKPNLKVSQDIDLLVHAARNVLLEFVLPLERTDQINFSYDVSEFNTFPALETPELGDVRWLTSRQSTERGTLERRGVGYQMEHGFMKTVEGQMVHNMRLLQIAECQSAALEYGVLSALMNCHTPNNNFLRKFNLGGRKTTVREMFDQEVGMFGIVQKNPGHGLSIIDTQIGMKTGQYGADLDTILLSHQLRAWLQVVAKENTDYYIAGPRGQKNLDHALPQMARWRDKMVIPVQFYNQEDRDGEALDMLRDNTQIGEFIQTQDPNRGGNYDEYRSASRIIMAYDNDTDAHFEVALDQALDACMRFDDNGYLHQIELHGQFSDKDKEQDLFHHRNSRNHLTYVRLFGQISKEHLNDDDALTVARTALNGFSQAKDLERAWRDITDTMKVMDSYTINPDSKNPEEDDNVWKFIQSLPELQDDKYELVQHPGRINAPPVYPLQEIKVDPAKGTFTLPGNPQGCAVPPGFQSWPGICQMADLFEKKGTDYDAWAAAGGERHFEAAARFVRLFRDFVDYLETIFHRGNTVFLDPRLASSYWHNPDKYVTAFENLVKRDVFPAWFLGADDLDPQDVGQPADNVRNMTDQVIKVLSGLNTAAADAMYDQLAKLGVSEAKINSIFNHSITNKLKPTQTPDRETMIKAAMQDLYAQLIAWEKPTKSKPIEDGQPRIYANFAGIDAKDINSFDEFLARFTAAADTAGLTADNEDLVTLAAPFWGALADYDVAKRNTSGAAQRDPRNISDSYNRGPFMVSEALADSIFNWRKNNENKGCIIMPSHPRLPDTQQTTPLPAGAVSSNPTATHIETQSPATNSFDYPSASLRKIDNPLPGFGGGDEPYVGSQGFVEGNASNTVRAHVHEIRSPNFQENMHAVGASSQNPLHVAVARVFYGTVVCKQVLKNMIKKDVWLPFEFLLMRPHANYVTLRGIWLAGKGKAGKTLTREPVFEISAATSIQATRATFTYYSKSVVHRPAKVFHAMNLFLAGYHGGMGSEFVTAVDEYDPISAMHNRPSIISVLLPVRHRQVQTPMDITGRHNLGHMGIDSAALDENKRLHYSQAPFYATLFGFGAIGGDETNADELNSTMAARTRANTMCYSGYHQRKDPKTLQYAVVHRGTGHFADYTYPGCGKVRSGQMQEFREPNYTGLTVV